MNGDETLGRLKDQGLAAWQARFVKDFLGDPATSHQVLMAPPGTGKSTTGAAVVANFTATRGGRVLVLIPGLALRAQWSHRILGLGCPSEVRVVDQKGFRQLLAEAPLGRTAWEKPGVYVLSLDFARKQEIASALKAVRWDLVVVDDAERMTSPLSSALVEGLVESGGVGRLLLLTSTRTPALSSWIDAFEARGGPAATIRATAWTGPLVQWDGSTVTRPEILFELLSYRPGPDELDFVRRLQDVSPLLRKALGFRDYFTRMLLRRAASSLFAAEQSLRILRRRLTDEPVRDPEDQDRPDRATPGSEDESDDRADTSVAPPSSVVDHDRLVTLVDECLDSLELVESDVKLDTAKQVIRRVLSRGSPQDARVCVMTSFADTASYVATALAELDDRVQKWTASMSDDELRSGIDRFRQTGGIVVCTDASIEGVDLPEMRDVLLYDLPGSDRLLDRRLGRFLRYGRTSAGRMYLLRDETDNCGDGLQRIVERVHAGWEPSVTSPGEDPDSEE